MSDSLISIVDDDQSFRDSMRRLLKSLGYAVAVFPSAAEFLASPNCGHRLPGRRCSHARNDRVSSSIDIWSKLGTRIPTILVTAYPDERPRSAC